MNKVYSVSELGDMLKVPRTTVNDYLNRYGQYIEFEQRGKRRVYTETALNVLTEICKMRNENSSFADIEQELMKRFPLQAEPHVDEPTVAENSADKEVKTEGSSIMQTPNQADNSAALISLKEISALSQYITKAEEERKSQIDRGFRRIIWPVVITILLLVIVAVISVLGTLKLMVSINENKSSSDDVAQQQHLEMTELLSGNEQKLLESVRSGVTSFSDKQQQQIDAIIFKLEEKTQLQQQELTKLREEMLEQRKTSNAHFEEFSKVMNSRLENETKLLNSAREAEQADLRQQIKTLQTKLADAVSSSANIKKQNSELEKLVTALTAETTKLNQLIVQLEADKERLNKAVEVAKATKPVEKVAPVVEAKPAETEPETTNEQN